MTRWMVVAALIVVLAILIVWPARTDSADYQGIAQHRDALARRATAINLAIVWREGDDRLWNGARLAADEVNRSGVRLPDGRVVRINLERHDEPEDVDGGTRVARLIARDANLVAVIGHSGTEIANRAAVSYEFTNIVYLATADTDPALTMRDGFEFVFRTVPTDNDFAHILASCLATMTPRADGAVGIGVLYARTPHYLSGFALSSLRSALAETEVNGRRAVSLVFERPFNPGLGVPGRPVAAGDALRRTLIEIDNFNRERTAYDSVVVLDDQPANVGYLIRRMRTMARVPLVAGGPSLASLAPIAGTNVKQLTAFDTVNSNEWRGAAPASLDLSGLSSSGGPVRLLVATPFSGASAPMNEVAGRYGTRFGRPLDFVSAQGYLAVKIIAGAASQAVSIAPVDLAAWLRSGRRIPGTGQPITFKSNGDITGQRVFIQSLLTDGRLAAPAGGR